MASNIAIIKIPGNKLMIFEAANFETSASWFNINRNFSVKVRIIIRGISKRKSTSLPRFKYIPHCFKFLAPNAYDTRVSMTVFIPNIAENATKFIVSFPRPTAAKELMSLRLPTKK